MKSQLNHLFDHMPNTKAGLEALLETLKKATELSHSPDDNHKFEANPSYPALCQHCGWIYPDVKDDASCGHTVAEHALLMIAKIQVLLKSGILDRGRDFVIMITIQTGEFPFGWLFDDDEKR